MVSVLIHRLSVDGRVEEEGGVGIGTCETRAVSGFGLEAVGDTSGWFSVRKKGRRLAGEVIQSSAIRGQSVQIGGHTSIASTRYRH